MASLGQPQMVQAWRDYHDLKAKGVTFARDPVEAPYGIVAVFRDLYGTLWDLIQFTDGRP